MVSPSLRPDPLVWSAGYVTVIDLKNLRRVLDHEAVWIDEVGEDVVSGAVPSYSPADGVSVIDHAPRTPHNRIKIGHQECNMVEAIYPRVRQHYRVMIAIAAQEGHHLGTICHAEAKRSFKEDPSCVHIYAVQVDVGQTEREILARTVQECIVSSLIKRNT